MTQNNTISIPTQIVNSVLDVGKVLVVEQYQLVLYFFMALWLKQIKDKVNKVEKGLTTIKHPKQIQENAQEIIIALEAIRQSFKADRVLLLQCHNGQEFYNKRSFIKFSTTFEVVEKEIDKIGNFYQNIPLTLLDNIFLEDHNTMRYINGFSVVDNDPKTSLFRQSNIRCYAIKKLNTKTTFQIHTELLFLTFSNVGQKNDFVHKCESDYPNITKQLETLEEIL